MESAPASALEVIGPDLLLELLVVALHAAPELGEPDELFERRLGRKV